MQDMRNLVLKTGRASKAIRELSGIEQRMEREMGAMANDDFEAGVREQRYYAGVIADTTGEMIDILDAVEAKVADYRRQVA
jgi:hypothetical protein